MKAVKVISNILLCIGLFLLTDVTILALGNHMEVDFYTMKEGGYMFRNSPLLAIVLAAILILVNLCITRLFYLRASAPDRIKRMRLSLAVMIVIETLICLIWQIHYVQEPIGDQYEVWNMAELLVHHQGADGNLQYFINCPYQKNIAYIMAAFVWIFGGSGLAAYRMFCMVCTILIVLFGALLAYRISGSEEAGTAAAVMLTEFVPLVLYSVYVYGTIPAICFTLLAFYCTLRFIDTRRVRYLFPEVISCCLAYAFHSSALIASVAVLIVLVLSAVEWRKSSKKAAAAALLSALMAFVLCAAVNLASGTAFMKDTGVPADEDAIPRSAWILMGI